MGEAGSSRDRQHLTLPITAPLAIGEDRAAPIVVTARVPAGAILADLIMRYGRNGKLFAFRSLKVLGPRGIELRFRFNAFADSFSACERHMENLAFSGGWLVRDL